MKNIFVVKIEFSNNFLNKYFDYADNPKIFQIYYHNLSISPPKK